MAKVFDLIREKDSFAQKIVLVIASAILAPALIFFLGKTYEQAQKSIDAENSRQQAIVLAQTRLWEDLSETILTYQTLALDVSWFKLTHVDDPKLFEAAYGRYNDKVVDLFATWRILISRSDTIASPEIADEIQDFMNSVLVEEDACLVEAAESKTFAPSQWQALHERSDRFTKAARVLIQQLARSIGLVASKSDQPDSALQWKDKLADGEKSALAGAPCALE